MPKPKITIEGCAFVFQCPKTWSRLLKTNIDCIRYCNSCERNVYLSSSAAEALGHAKAGRCVAIPVDLTDAARRKRNPAMVVGLMGPPPGYPE